MSVIGRIFARFSSTRRELLAENSEYSVYLDYLRYSSWYSYFLLTLLPVTALLVWFLYIFPAYYVELGVLLLILVIPVVITIDQLEALTLSLQNPQKVMIHLLSHADTEPPTVIIDGSLPEASCSKISRYQGFYNYQCPFKIEKSASPLLTIAATSFQLPQLDIQLSERLFKVPLAIIIQIHGNGLVIKSPQLAILPVIPVNSFCRDMAALKIFFVSIPIWSVVTVWLSVYAGIVVTAIFLCVFAITTLFLVGFNEYIY